MKRWLKNKVTFKTIRNLPCPNLSVFGVNPHGIPPCDCRFVSILSTSEIQECSKKLCPVLAWFKAKARSVK